MLEKYTTSTVSALAFATVSYSYCVLSASNQCLCCRYNAPTSANLHISVVLSCQFYSSQKTNDLQEFFQETISIVHFFLKVP